MVHERSEPPEKEPSEFSSIAELLRALFPGDAKPWAPPETAEELHERVCLAAKMIDADVETLYTETAANPLALGRWLRYVETRGRELTVYGKHVMRNSNAPTVKCLRCMDAVYVTGKSHGEYSTETFCDCEAGMAAEAGTWARILYGDSWEKFRDPTQKAKRELEAYCRARGRNEFELRQRIKTAEKRRKRRGGEIGETD